MLRNYTAYFVIETSGECGTVEEAGFYPANTFGEAIDYLEEFYDDELAVIKHLELLDTSLVYMKPETAAKIVSELYG